MILELAAEGCVKTSEIAVDFGWISFHYEFFGNCSHGRKIEHHASFLNCSHSYHARVNLRNTAFCLGRMNIEQ